MSIITELPDLQSDMPVELPAAVIERLRSHSLRQRMLPAIAAQALEIAKDPDCDIQDFTTVVERDVSLAVNILRLANSVLVSTGRPVMNLRQAVVRLGFLQCRHLIITSSFISTIKTMKLDEEWIRELLMRHSFTTALLASNVNRTLDLGFHGAEFTGGLMHDVGRVLLAVAFADGFESIDSMEFQEDTATLRAEEAIILTNHCEVGTWFVMENGLPDQLSAAVRYHHEPLRAAAPHRSYVTLIAACDQMANHLQRHDQAEGYDPGQCPTFQLLEEYVTPQAFRRLNESALSLMDMAHLEAKQMLAF